MQADSPYEPLLLTSRLAWPFHIGPSGAVIAARKCPRWLILIVQVLTIAKRPRSTMAHPTDKSALEGPDYDFTAEELAHSQKITGVMFLEEDPASRGYTLPKGPACSCSDGRSELVDNAKSVPWRRAVGLMEFLRTQGYNTGIGLHHYKSPSGETFHAATLAPLRGHSYLLAKSLMKAYPSDHCLWFPYPPSNPKGPFKIDGRDIHH